MPQTGHTHTYTPLMRQQHKSPDAARSTHIHTDQDTTQPGIAHKAQDSRKLCKHQHFYCCTAHTQQSGLQPKERLCLVQGSATAGLSGHADSCSTSQWQTCRSSAGQAKHSKLVVRKKDSFPRQRVVLFGGHSSNHAQLPGPCGSWQGPLPPVIQHNSGVLSLVEAHNTRQTLRCRHEHVHTHGTAKHGSPTVVWAPPPRLPAA